MNLLGIFRRQPRKGAVLGTSEIEAALASGRVGCWPRPAAIQGAHIDVRLGKHYWLLKRSWRIASGDKLSAGLRLRDAEPRDWFELREADGEGDLWLPASSYGLFHTEEYIGTAEGSGLLPRLHTRSTFARWAFGCHPSAGWGDEGFATRWTLEITNPHPFDVWLPAGGRVGCVSFETIKGKARAYSLGTRYNVQPAEWTPEAMLPRRGNW